MNMAKFLITLIISGFIGYCTNFIAVKMMFRPLRPIYIKGRRLPFTPGIIPKSKPRIAKAISNAVSRNLLTGNDISNALMSENASRTAVNEITCAITKNGHCQIKDILGNITTEESYNRTKEKLNLYISEKIKTALNNADVGSIIISEATMAIKEKVSGTMIAMFINDELIKSVAAPVADKIEEYINGKGGEKINSLVREEIESVEQKTLDEIFTAAGLTEEKIKIIAEEIYSLFIKNKLPALINSIDFNKIIEDKVNEMDVMELEKLVMSVMKNELNSVVRLGIPIGIFIGLINGFINI